MFNTKDVILSIGINEWINVFLETSLPHWQDCHEMWCKKRRRRSEVKATDEGSRSQAKQPKQEPNTASVPGSQAQAAEGQAIISTQGNESRLPLPIYATKDLPRHSIETVEMDTDEAPAEYSTKQEPSYYRAEQKNQYAYAEQSLKAIYSTDSYYQRDYTEIGKNNTYQSSGEVGTEFNRHYTREPAYSYESTSSRDGSEGASGYTQSGVYYEQLSPAADQAEQPYSKHYSGYGYTERNSNSGYEHAPVQCKEDAVFGFSGQYSKREVYEYANLSVGGDHKVSSPSRRVESSSRQ